MIFGLTLGEIIMQGLPILMGLITSSGSFIKDGCLIGSMLVWFQQRHGEVQ